MVITGGERGIDGIGTLKIWRAAKFIPVILCLEQSGILIFIHVIYKMQVLCMTGIISLTHVVRHSHLRAPVCHHTVSPMMQLQSYRWQHDGLPHLKADVHLKPVLLEIKGHPRIINFEAYFSPIMLFFLFFFFRLCSFPSKIFNGTFSAYIFFTWNVGWEISKGNQMSTLSVLQVKMQLIKKSEDFLY